MVIPGPFANGVVDPPVVMLMVLIGMGFLASTSSVLISADKVVT
jgi:hypothetical protein